MNKRFSTSSEVFNKPTFPFDIDKISYSLPNRSILRSDSQGKYHGVLLAFDISIFECAIALCYNGALDASLVSKSKNQVLNILMVYDKNNNLAQRFLEALGYMALSKEINVILGDFNKKYFDNGPITQGLSAVTFVQLVKHPTHVRGGLIDHVYVKFWY